jgi:hypothetical protein
MNKAQFIIMWITSGLLVLCFMFPPWVHATGYPDRMSEQYAFIMRPPTFGGPDTERIVLQVGAIIVIAIAASVTAGRTGR